MFTVNDAMVMPTPPQHVTFTEIKPCNHGAYRAPHPGLLPVPPADAQVGDWEGDTRTVLFTTPVDAPAFVKRLVGKDVMQVKEEQRRVVGADGAITLTSTPQPDMPGGAKVSTQAVFTFRAAANSSDCQVSASAALCCQNLSAAACAGFALLHHH